MLQKVIQYGLLQQFFEDFEIGILNFIQLRVIENVGDTSGKLRPWLTFVILLFQFQFII